MDAEFMVGLLRQMQHDLANHLQVLSGYLQLGQPERAQEYLHSVIESLDSERMVLKSLPAPAGLYFYDQLFKAYGLGTILRFKDCDLSSWQILQERCEPAASLEVLRREMGNRPETVIYLSIREDAGGIELVYNGGYAAPRVFRIDKE